MSIDLKAISCRTSFARSLISAYDQGSDADDAQGTTSRLENRRRLSGGLLVDFVDRRSSHVSGQAVLYLSDRRTGVGPSGKPRSLQSEMDYIPTTMWKGRSSKFMVFGVCRRRLDNRGTLTHVETDWRPLDGSDADVRRLLQFQLATRAPTNLYSSPCFKQAENIVDNTIHHFRRQNRVQVTVADFVQADIWKYDKKRVVLRTGCHEIVVGESDVHIVRKRHRKQHVHLETLQKYTTISNYPVRGGVSTDDEPTRSDMASLSITCPDELRAPAVSDRNREDPRGSRTEARKPAVLFVGIASELERAQIEERLKGSEFVLVDRSDPMGKKYVKMVLHSVQLGRSSCNDAGRNLKVTHQWLEALAHGSVSCIRDRSLIAVSNYSGNKHLPDAASLTRLARVNIHKEGVVMELGSAQRTRGVTLLGIILASVVSLLAAQMATTDDNWASVINTAISVLTLLIVTTQKISEEYMQHNLTELLTGVKPIRDIDQLLAAVGTDMDSLTSFLLCVDGVPGYTSNWIHDRGACWKQHTDRRGVKHGGLNATLMRSSMVVRVQGGYIHLPTGTFFEVNEGGEGSHVMRHFTMPEGQAFSGTVFNDAVLRGLSEGCARGLSSTYRHPSLI